MICGNNLNWLLNLNLIYETLWTGTGSGLLNLVLEKLHWFRLTGQTTLVLLMWKWNGLFLRKTHLLRCWGRLSLLNWIGALTLSLLLKLPPRKLEPWFILWSFLLPRLLCISINLLYGQAWNTVVMSGCCPSCYLELLDKLQNRICRTVGPSLAASLESLSKCSQFKSFLWVLLW